MKKVHMVKSLLILVTLFAIVSSPLGVQTAKAEQTVSYDWESGMGTALGIFGSIRETSISTEPSHTGSRSLKIIDDPEEGGEIPQVFIFWVTGLTDGDTILASFWVFDDQDNEPSGAIWGHYTAGEDINTSQGDAGGNPTYSPGTGWSQLSYEWTFDLAGNTRDGLVVKTLIDSVEEDNTIYVDDAAITVSNNAAKIYTPGSIPTVGELVINEIMYHPTTDDGADEWFEVVNVSGEDRVVNRCTLTDDGEIDLSFVSHIIPPNSYFVYGANSTTGGVTADYDYGVIRALADTGDGDIITITCHDIVVDEVNYEVAQNGWPASEGISISFGIPDTSVGNYHLDNDVGSSWGDSTSLIGGGNSDYGTPGAINDNVVPNAIKLTSLTGDSDTVSLLVYLVGGVFLLLAGGLFILRRRSAI